MTEKDDAIYCLQFKRKWSKECLPAIRSNINNDDGAEFGRVNINSM